MSKQSVTVRAAWITAIGAVAAAIAGAYVLTSKSPSSDDSSQEPTTSLKADSDASGGSANSINIKDAHDTILNINSLESDPTKTSPPAGTSYQAAPTNTGDQSGRQNASVSNSVGPITITQLDSENAYLEDPENTKLLQLKISRDALVRASDLASWSEMGQSEAITALLSAGVLLNGEHLNGVSFTGLELTNFSLDDIQLCLGRLEECTFEDASMNGWYAPYLQLRSANFVSCSMRNCYAPFIDATGVTLSGTDLSGSNFSFSSFRDANFKNAKLNGTSFAYCDLRGADFTNADLTGAFLVGAILDDATFSNAVFETTDVQGASARNVEFSRRQHSGLGRHSAAIKDGNQEVRAWITEEWKSDRFSTGLEFDKILDERRYTDSFSDPSLPKFAELSKYGAPRGYKYEYPEYVRISIDRSIIGHSGRRHYVEEVSRRILDRIAANLSFDSTIQGDGSQIDQWEQFIEASSRDTKSISDIYLTTDSLMLHLLSTAGVNDEDVDWDAMASNRLSLERKLRKKEVPTVESDGWIKLFPEDVVLSDLDSELVTRCYRDWSLGRIGNLPKLIWWERHCFPEFDLSKRMLKLRLGTAYLRRTPEGIHSSNSWPSHKVADEAAAFAGSSSNNLMFAPVRSRNLSQSRIVLAFKHSYDNYAVEPGWMEIGRAIERRAKARHSPDQIMKHLIGRTIMTIGMEVIDTKKLGPRSDVLVVLVDVKKCKVIYDGSEVWSGPLQVVSSND